MNSGRLDKIISIVKSVSTARNTDGAPVITISTLASNVWAEVKPITGRETFINDAKFYESDVLFTMRYTTVITELCRISYKNNYYDIDKIINWYDDNTELQVVGKMVR